MIQIQSKLTEHTYKHLRGTFTVYIMYSIFIEHMYIYTFLHTTTFIYQNKVFFFM